MPPKLRRPAGVLGAAAKAGPKAKAAVRPKARPRGAAGVRIRRDRRRPAADIREPGEEVEEVFSREDFLRGVEVNAADIPFTELKKGVKIVVTEATYWEEPVKVAGLLEKVESDGGSKTICLNLLGTTSESLVKWKGKFPGQVLAVHLCHKDCGRLSKDGLLHCDRLRVGKVEAEEPWMQNLAGMDPHPKEDEMEALRRRAEKVGTGEDAPGDGKRKSESSGSEGSSREKKAKKKKKKKKKNHKGSKEKKKVNGTKGLAEVFGTTGLDPDPDVRKKALRRAKKIAKKKGRNSSSTSSSRSSEESSVSGEGGSSVIFGQEVRVKSIWLRIPGALTGATLQQMQSSLVQQTGQPWELDKKSLPPIFTQYWKAVLDGRATRPMSREMHTLSFIVDLLLQGRAAAACDVATQRLKALEQVAGGGDFRVAQRQELVPLDHQTMSSATETMEASRLQREDLKARAAASGKGSWDRSRSKGDCDFWEKGKNKKGDYVFGKGKGQKGDGKKGDGKTGHEEREKKGG